MPDKQFSLLMDKLVRMHSFTQSTLQRPDLQGSLSDSRGWRIFHKIVGVQDFGLVGGFSVLLIATCMQGFGGKVQFLHSFFSLVVLLLFFVFQIPFFIPPTKE